MTIFERVKKYSLPLGEYAVFGSGLLDVWGIRHANDLDIIAIPKLFEELRHDGTWQENVRDGFTLLTKGEANVCTVQDKPTHGDYCPDRVKLVKEAVIINGVPFVLVEEVIACKKAYGRPKDFDDIASIEKYIHDHKGQDIYKIN